MIPGWFDNDVPCVRVSHLTKEDAIAIASEVGGWHDTYWPLWALAKGDGTILAQTPTTPPCANEYRPLWDNAVARAETVEQGMEIFLKLLKHGERKEKKYA